MRIDSMKIEMIMGEKGMTKLLLSEKSGVSRQNITAIIHRGTCEPRTAAKLALGLYAVIPVCWWQPYYDR